MTQTLTLYQLEDFITELKHRAIDEVHGEPIRNTVGSSIHGARYSFRIVLTAMDEFNDVVLACTIQTGTTDASVIEREPHHKPNLLDALKLVKTHLWLTEGLKIRPGIYHHHQDGLASSFGLWTFDENDNHKLIPICQNENDENGKNGNHNPTR